MKPHQHSIISKQGNEREKKMGAALYFSFKPTNIKHARGIEKGRECRQVAYSCNNINIY